VGDGGLDLSQLPGSRVPSAWERIAWSKVLGFAGTVLLFVAVGAIALQAVDDARHEEKEAAAPTTTAATDEPPEPAEPDEPDDVAGGLSVIQALMTFNGNATPQQIQHIRDEWESNDDLYGIVLMDAEELEANIGIGIAAIAGYGNDEDRAAIEAFVCGYQGDPAVALAGLDEPCEGSFSPDAVTELTDDEPEHDPIGTVQLEVWFADGTPVRQQRPIRDRFEHSPYFTDVTYRRDGEGQSGWVTMIATWARQPGRPDL
jgi:hypothetical protein